MFRLKTIINELLFLPSIILSVFAVAFCLEISYFNTGINDTALKIIIILLCALILFAAVLNLISNEVKALSVKKITFFILILVFSITCGYILLLKTGIYEKIDSVEDLRAFVSSFGVYSEIFYILIQFLQVAVLPIPSFITVGAGVILFGPLKAALLSIVGIVLGSFFAFFVARKLGLNVVIWLIGERNLNKALSFISGKTRIFFTFMFLMPFFPDDMLCFAAGITSVDARFFAIMITCVRTITVFTACYSINNSLIPYNTVSGISVWIIVLICAIALTIVVAKKGDSIEQKITLLFTRKKED